MKILSISIIISIYSYIITSLTLNSATTYNGPAITQQAESGITQLIKKASIISGNDILKNIAFLKTNLNNLYQGNWNIIINTNQHLYSNLNYSMNNEWWLHWYGKNPYYPTWIYGMQRVAQQYDPVNEHYTAAIRCQTKFGTGFSLYQKMLIMNSFGIDLTTQQLNNLLKENIFNGNWNILRNDHYQALFYVSVFTRNNKWFTYCTYDTFYFVYLS